MAEQQFKVGDLVMLKSGGPKMTVSAISPNGAAIECMWFDKKDERQFDTFSPSVLSPWQPSF
ncbi:MAG: DUF2158 domain-containing protein [Candidatus Bipolaricaulis sp.]|nr:DUF2158 domain-containing protein [Candidatus Bipolaricaulis sp.]